MLRAIDLFAGAGGFGLGFAQTGFHVEHAIESDQWACDTLRRNDPEERTRVWQEDIRRISDDRIRREIMRYPDVIIGGPPCQGFSQANNGRDPKDPRNSLFWDFLRFVGALEPRTIVIENVTGLLRSKTTEGRRVIEIVGEELAALGYTVRTEELRATEYGVPQMRRRIFIAGAKGSTFVPRPEPTHGDSLPLFEKENARALEPVQTLWDAISDLPQVDVGDRREPIPYDQDAENEYQVELRRGADEIWNHLPMHHSKRIIERFKQIRWGESQSDVPDEHAPWVRNSNGKRSGKRYDQNNRRMRPDRPCHTIPASFYANFVHPFLHRNFTPREGARVQSFPDWYVFEGKPTVVSDKLLAKEGRHSERRLCQYNQIGNAVPPLLAEKLAEHLRLTLEI